MRLQEGCTPSPFPRVKLIEADMRSFEEGLDATREGLAAMQDDVEDIHRSVIVLQDERVELFGRMKAMMEVLERMGEDVQHGVVDAHK